MLTSFYFTGDIDIIIIIVIRHSYTEVQQNTLLLELKANMATECGLYKKNIYTLNECNGNGVAYNSSPNTILTFNNSNDVKNKALHVKTDVISQRPTDTFNN